MKREESMRIAGTGCCLIDSIYMNCSYDSEQFASLWSKKRGDGGMIEGGLVLSEDVERFSGKSFNEIISALSGGRSPDTVNLGGPAIIALVHAAQVLAGQGAEVSFYGALGADDLASEVRRKLSSTSVSPHFYVAQGLPTQTTEVFDDPSQRNGKGERSFITNVGAAGEFRYKDIPDEFYESDIILLGGTALVPNLHTDIHRVLSRAKAAGCITVVGTVYDFINEKAHPDRKWPLGDDSSYQFIDLLVTDQEEALRLSGKNDIMEAAETLISFGVGALIITRGALDILVWSGGTLIEKQELTSFPVSAYIDDLLEKDPSLRKDTTGCGDNFMGGLLVSLVKQLDSGRKQNLELLDLCAWGASSGGFTCMYHGGMFDEHREGEKASRIIPAVEEYKIRSENSS